MQFGTRRSSETHCTIVAVKQRFLNDKGTTGVAIYMYGNACCCGDGWRAPMKSGTYQLICLSINNSLN